MWNDIVVILLFLGGPLLLVYWLLFTPESEDDKLTNSYWVRDRDTDTGDYVYRPRAEYNAHHAEEKAHVREIEESLS